VTALDSGLPEARRPAVLGIFAGIWPNATVARLDGNAAEVKLAPARASAPSPGRSGRRYASGDEQQVGVQGCRSAAFRGSSASGRLENDWLSTSGSHQGGEHGRIGVANLVGLGVASTGTKFVAGREDGDAGAGVDG